MESFSPESARFYRKTSAKCLQYTLTSSHFPSVLAVTFVKPLSSFTTRNFKCVFLQVCCGLVQSEPICDQTEFLHANGTCVACPACVPGEELSEVAHTHSSLSYCLLSRCATSLQVYNTCDFQDCGFGDGGEGVCIPCEERKFSTETGVTPCRTCTQCSLLNRREETACSPTGDSLCGRCLPG